MDSSVLGSSVRIEEDVVLVGSKLGPNVTVERGARILGTTLRDCIVGPNAVVEDSILHDSLIGGHARIAGFQGSLSVLDFSEVGK